ncbi:D-alanyl-D-alanine carboxypeptidase family protein [Virgibacillus halophilus]|uniref:D-alanyl-D-alanine carboxypeptidase family protein n=1 Tax=Tigheibacillus halophilus TaxID=361280 RepID=UPI00363316E6
MKKCVFSLVGALLILVSGMQPVVHAEEKDDQTLGLAKETKSAILLERDTGKILFQKDADKRLPPASMTKLMTLLIIMQELEKGDLTKNEKVRVSENAASMGGSQIFLEAGEEMSVNDLLKGIAVASGNDASVAMAEKIAGSESSFVKRMNKEAKKLNLKNTQFQNVSGLPAKNHYSTAHDMAMIAKELLRYEDITNYTSIYEDYLRKGEENEFWLVNTNKLVKHYQGVDGLKTGFTNEAKYCLTATAKKEGMRVVTVVMGAETIKKRNAATAELLDYAYNHYNTKQLFKKGQTVSKLDMFKAENRHVNVVTAASVSTLLKKGEKPEEISTETMMNENFNLPIKKGDQVGELRVKKGNKVLSATPLIVEDDVEPATYFTLFKRSLQKLSKSN